MKRLIDFFLDSYSGSDLLLFYKARFLLIIAFALQIICVVMALAFPLIGIDWRMSATAFLTGAAASPLLLLIKKGHYALAGHSLTCLALAAVWFCMFTERSTNPLGHLDSIILIMGLLMLPSIITIQRASSILLYFAANLIILGFYLNYASGRWVSGSALHEYAFDCLVGIGFMMITSYESFRIQRKALNRAYAGEASLKRSKERYRNIFENIQDVYFEIGIDGCILEVSPSVEQVTLFKREDLINSNIKRLAPTSTDWQSAIKATLHNERINDFEIEIPLDGNAFQTLSINALLTRDTAGQPHKIIGSLRDITARCLATKENQALQEQLLRSQKMEALGLMASGVAHDLNNVLSGTVSYPDLMLLELEQGTPIYKRLIKIRDSGRKAAEIVQDLLTLARRGIVNPKVVNLNRIIEDYLASPECETLELHHPLVSISTSLEPQLTNIKGSSVHLRKAIMNLISNAAEAEPQGGIVCVETANVSLNEPPEGYATISPGAYVMVRVSDNGIGIAQSDLNRIFEPFYTKKVMGRSGTGLGMAVVWGTIEDHCGYLTVHSREGQGTCFSLYFPATEECLSIGDEACPVQTYIGRHETILVIDDVREQRELACDILSRLNYKVCTAASGEEAVEWLKANPAELVMLDMLMAPGIDGFETFRRIKKLHPRQKAILVSGYAENDRVHAAQAMGAGAYVRKPYTIEKLGVAIRRELDRRA